MGEPGAAGNENRFFVISTINTPPRGFTGLRHDLKFAVAEFSPVAYALKATNDDLLHGKHGSRFRTGQRQFIEIKNGLMPADLARFLNDTPQDLKGNAILSALRKLREVPEGERVPAFMGLLQQIQRAGLSQGLQVKLIGDLMNETAHMRFREAWCIGTCVQALVAAVQIAPQVRGLDVHLYRAIGNWPLFDAIEDVSDLLDMSGAQADLLIQAGFSDAAMLLLAYAAEQLGENLNAGLPHDETPSELLDFLIGHVARAMTAGDASDEMFADLFFQICAVMNDVTEFQLSDEGEREFESLLIHARRTGTLIHAGESVGNFEREGLFNALLSDEPTLLQLDFSSAFFRPHQLPRVLLRLAALHDLETRNEKLHAFFLGCEEIYSEEVCDAAFFRMFRELVEGQIQLDEALLKERLQELRKLPIVGKVSRELQRLMLHNLFDLYSTWTSTSIMVQQLDSVIDPLKALQHGRD